MKAQIEQVRARFARQGATLSLARFDERMQQRMAQLAAGDPALSREPVPFKGRTRWSSAL